MDCAQLRPSDWATALYSYAGAGYSRGNTERLCCMKQGRKPPDGVIPSQGSVECSGARHTIHAGESESGGRKFEIILHNSYVRNRLR